MESSRGSILAYKKLADAQRTVKGVDFLNLSDDLLSKDETLSMM